MHSLEQNGVMSKKSQWELLCCEGLPPMKERKRWAMCLCLFRQGLPSVNLGTLTLWPSAGFWNSLNMKLVAKAKLWLACLILAAKEWQLSLEPGGSLVPQRVPRGSLPMAWLWYQQGPTLMADEVHSKQSPQQKKRWFPFPKVWFIFFLSFPLFTKNFPILIASKISTANLYGLGSHKLKM